MITNPRVISLAPVLVAIFLVSSIQAEPAAEESRSQLLATIAQRKQTIDLYRNEKVDIDLRIKHAESAVRRLLSVVQPDAEFDARNEAIGMQYDIRVWRAESDNMATLIADLEKANNNDTIQLGQVNTATVGQSAGNTLIQAVSQEELARIREQQRQLIAASRSLGFAQAMVNLARAKALEPMIEKPVLGEAVTLLSSLSATSPQKFIGLMQHIGGNQYYLEAILKSGKQDFLIGDLHFSRTVPAGYGDTVSVIWLDMQDKDNPVLQYAIK